MGEPKAESRVAEIARRIASVVKLTPVGESLTVSFDVAENLTAAIDEGDFSEVLGDLIENAARYARSSGGVGAAQTPGGTTIIVADDGPGIADNDKDAILMRDVRLNAKRDTSGLGLAIVSDIVEAYGGQTIMADATPSLKVEIYLPRRR